MHENDEDVLSSNFNSGDDIGICLIETGLYR